MDLRVDLDEQELSCSKVHLLKPAAHLAALPCQPPTLLRHTVIPLSTTFGFLERLQLQFSAPCATPSTCAAREGSIGWSEGLMRLWIQLYIHTYIHTCTHARMHVCIHMPLACVCVCKCNCNQLHPYLPAGNPKKKQIDTTPDPGGHRPQHPCAQGRTRAKQDKHSHSVHKDKHAAATGITSCVPPSRP